MKKFFVYLGIAMTATLSLTNCTEQQIETPVQTEGIPFEVSTILTRTTNDGLDTKWAADDAINLFHAEAGTTGYVSDGQFTVDAELTGKFTGNLASELTAEKYDWYAIYPYSDAIKTPASKTTGVITVGSAAKSQQTQEGNDSMVHLSGIACPLYGIVKDVNKSETPSFTMNNLTSVICIEVTNKVNVPLVVKTVAFTSSEDIVGTFLIDFANSEGPSFKSSTASKTANLSVTGGTTIAQNGSAKFYIAIKPHTASAGSTLTLSVNGKEKSVTLTKDKKFEAGKIKNLKYNYNYAEGLSLAITEDFSNVTTAKSENTLVKISEVTNFITINKVYSTTNDGVVKFGSSSAEGEMITADLNLSKASKVTIRAKAWVSSSSTPDKASIIVRAGKAEITQKIDVPEDVTKNDFADYTFDIPAQTASEPVTITGNKRFYVDSIKIEYAE